MGEDGTYDKSLDPQWVLFRQISQQMIASSEQPYPASVSAVRKLVDDYLPQIPSEHHLECRRFAAFTLLGIACQNEADVGEAECADRWNELFLLGFESPHQYHAATLYIAQYGLAHKHSRFAIPYVERHLGNVAERAKGDDAAKKWVAREETLLQELLKNTDQK